MDTAQRSHRAGEVIAEMISQVNDIVHGDSAATVCSFEMLLSGMLGYMTVRCGLAHVRPQQADQLKTEVFELIRKWLAAHQAKLN